jgi:hypothetical protein
LRPRRKFAEIWLVHSLTIAAGHGTMVF